VDARLAKTTPERNARFAGKDLQSQSADAGQSPSAANLCFAKASSGYAGQKRAAWIRNADRCTLGKASQEVMPL